MDAERAFLDLLETEKKKRALEGAILAGDRKSLFDTLKKHVSQDKPFPPETREGEEREMKLALVATLLGQMEGEPSVDLLIDILALGHDEAYNAATAALETRAFDRFKELALSLERALGRLPVGHPALSELPYLLADVGEPGSTKLLKRFLEHKDPEAVAAAIEALVELGDPSVLTVLEPLMGDTRQASVADDEELVTIGDLAAEAHALLEELGASTDKVERGPSGGSGGSGGRPHGGGRPRERRG